jgi:hypothetical protein
MSDRAAKLLHALMWSRAYDPDPRVPLEWEELNETQRDAFRSVVEQLSQAQALDVAEGGDVLRALTQALTAEHYRRARERIVASPEEHQAAMAIVGLEAVADVLEAPDSDLCDCAPLIRQPTSPRTGARMAHLCDCTAVVASRTVRGGAATLHERECGCDG